MMDISSHQLIPAHLKIIFFGTPEFAATTLAYLADKGFNIVAVVTAPDKPAGRGMKMQQSAVKICATERNIPVLQPEKLKHVDFIHQLKSFEADLQIVIAFRMLPEVVWNMPPKGTVNLHASLLPDYRGAAPINWAIINGEDVTGITTFKLKHEIDTGDILLQSKVKITDDMTAGELHDLLMHEGKYLVEQTIIGLTQQTIKPIQQNARSDKHAPKLFTQDCKIDWSHAAVQVYNLIRGLSPFPGAFTTLNGKMLKLYQTKIIDLPAQLRVGEVDSDNKSYIHVGCGNGAIAILELQIEGKKRMGVADFLRGNNIHGMLLI